MTLETSTVNTLLSLAAGAVVSLQVWLVSGHYKVLSKLSNLHARLLALERQLGLRTPHDTQRFFRHHEHSN